MPQPENVLITQPNEVKAMDICIVVDGPDVVSCDGSAFLE
jgi:hypothetical protein